MSISDCMVKVPYLRPNPSPPLLFSTHLLSILFTYCTFLLYLYLYLYLFQPLGYMLVEADNHGNADQFLDFVLPQPESMR